MAKFFRYVFRTFCIGFNVIFQPFFIIMLWNNNSGRNTHFENYFLRIIHNIFIPFTTLSTLHRSYQINYFSFSLIISIATLYSIKYTLKKMPSIIELLGATEKPAFPTNRFSISQLSSLDGSNTHTQQSNMLLHTFHMWILSKTVNTNNQTYRLALQRYAVMCVCGCVCTRKGLHMP